MDFWGVVGHGFCRVEDPNFGGLGPELHRLRTRISSVEDPNFSGEVGRGKWRWNQTKS